MNNRMRSAGATVASLWLALAGCSASPPWERDWGHSTSSSSLGGQVGSSASGAAHPSLAAAPSTAPAANPFITATQSVNQAFKSAGDKVASALEVKPKVIPADDPARLSNKPEQLTPELYVQAAQYSENQGSIAQARQQFDRALELDPRNVNTLVAFARFHDRQGNGDEALRRYQQARSLAPTNTIVLNDLGLFHARRGDLATSLETLQQAVRLDPRNVRYRNNLAAALVESQRVTEAVDVLRVVHPEATALFNAACLLSMKNQTQQAAALLEQSLRIDPSLVAANQMLRQLRSSDTVLAQPAMPPRGDEAVTVDAPWTPRLETAYRSRPQVWESTPARDRTDETFGPDDLPRKLPKPE
jgi:Tfp pilus assembly protein PilF